MNLGCLGADTGWARGKLLGASEAKVVTSRGAGVVIRGDDVVNIGTEGAGVTTGGGVGPGLEAAWPELLWASPWPLMTLALVTGEAGARLVTRGGAGVVTAGAGGADSDPNATKAD